MRRMILILNPRGGTSRGSAILEQVRPIFAEAGIELDVQLTSRRAHAAELAENLDLAGCDGLCLIGGGGTIHEAARGLMWGGRPAAVPPGIIPRGDGQSPGPQLGCPPPPESARGGLGC